MLSSLIRLDDVCVYCDHIILINLSISEFSKGNFMFLHETHGNVSKNKSSRQKRFKKNEYNTILKSTVIENQSMGTYSEFMNKLANYIIDCRCKSTNHLLTKDSVILVLFYSSITIILRKV